jgi:hypothetical protein
LAGSLSLSLPNGADMGQLHQWTVFAGFGIIGDDDALVA